MTHELVRAWRDAHAVTLRFLDAVPEEALGDRYAPRTRTVAAQFMHIHYVRVKNLEGRGKAFLGDLTPFPRDAEPTRAELVAALTASGEAMTRLFEEIAATGRVRSWSGSPPATFLAYHVAHEAHHRGLAAVAVRLGGHKLPRSLVTDLWYTWRKGADADAGA